MNGNVQGSSERRTLNSVRLLAFVAVVVFVIAACASSFGAEAEVSGPISEPETANSSEPEISGGFGSGSQVSAAGDYADRILDVEGEWKGNAYVYAPAPEVCGRAEPLAAEGAGRLKTSQVEGDIAGAIVAEVLVYESPQVAATQVGLLNGPNAAACDQVDPLDVPLVGIDSGGNRGVVWIDFGDGVGMPADQALAVPDGSTYDSRRYEGTATVGSVRQDFDVFETWVADGPFLVKFAAAGREPLPLSVQIAEALFASPAPDISAVAGLDEDMDALRRAALDDDDLPEIFQLAGPASASRRNRVNCYTLFLPEGRLNGPSWVALSPGLNGSRVTQSGSVFISETAAIAAFDQVVDLGTDCYFEVTELSEDRYQLRDGSFQVSTVDGLRIVEIKLDFDKSDGFDAELQTAIVRSGPFILQVTFLGLPGEAPDLAALVRLAVEQMTAE